jgi:hypothetical protein
VKFFDPDMRNFSGFYLLMYVVMLTLLVWSIAGFIAWGLTAKSFLGRAYELGRREP